MPSCSRPTERHRLPGRTAGLMRHPSHATPQTCASWPTADADQARSRHDKLMITQPPLSVRIGILAGNHQATSAQLSRVIDPKRRRMPPHSDRLRLCPGSLRAARSPSIEPMEIAIASTIRQPAWNARPLGRHRDALERVTGARLRQQPLRSSTDSYRSLSSRSISSEIPTNQATEIPNCLSSTSGATIPVNMLFENTAAISSGEDGPSIRYQVQA